jgi:RNA recognition motif-containing protein
VSWQELRDLCSTFGVVVRAEVVLDRATGQSKGFGTVRFEQSHQALTAIQQLNDMDYGGRKIIARMDEYQ